MLPQPGFFNKADSHAWVRLEGLGFRLHLGYLAQSLEGYLMAKRLNSCSSGKKPGTICFVQGSGAEQFHAFATPLCTVRNLKLSLAHNMRPLTPLNPVLYLVFETSQTVPGAAGQTGACANSCLESSGSRV
jgi:hypothetical protein